MKTPAAVLWEYGQDWQVEEIELDDPREGEVLVRLAASGLPRVYWLFVLATLLFTLGNSSDAFLSLRSQQLGVTIRDLLLMIVAFNITNAVVAWPVGALSDRVGRRETGLLHGG